MEPNEWDYNELLGILSKAMNVELDDDDDDDDDDENTMRIVGVKSCTTYSGGRKLPNPPSVKVHLNGNPGPINIDFDHNY